MTVTVFHKCEKLAQGTPEEVAPAMRALEPLARSSDLLVFDDDSGRQIDLDLRAPARPRRGRPPLGVEAREITLLPRHWQWLAEQRGGTSATLRKLVDQAIARGRTPRECQDAAYRFLSAIAGDLPQFEDAVRELYKEDRTSFDRFTQGWPPAITAHARQLAWPR